MSEVQRGAVAIVTYNAAAHIRECLASLEPFRATWQVAVADNGSTDGTIEIIRREFPWVRLVEVGANVGCSAGCNRAAAATDAPWVLFLNPDTIVPAGSLDRLLPLVESAGAVVAAPRVNGVDGEYQPRSADRLLPTFRTLFLESILAHHLLPRRVWFRMTQIRGFDPRTTRRVEQPISAALLVRRDVLDGLGGFDERFRPIWFDDVDLCRRIIDAGHEILYVAEVSITHIGQHTLPFFSSTVVLSRWNANMLRYARKHFPPWQAGLLRGGAIAGAIMRGLLRGLHPRSRKAAPGHFALAARMTRSADESRWMA